MIKRVKVAQTSIFIIVAILIVLLILVVFISQRKSSDNDNEDIHPDVLPIHNFVLDCLKKTSEDSINETSITGGRFFDVLESTPLYYFYKGENMMPTKNEIEKEISDMIKIEILECINNFEGFPDYVIEAEDPEINITIEKELVVFQVDYPISVTKDENTYLLKYFYYAIPVRLGIVYDSIKEIIDDQMSHPDSICITCITNIAEKNNLEIDMYEIDEENVVFTVTDTKSKLNNVDFKFNFFNAY